MNKALLFGFLDKKTINEHNVKMIKLKYEVEVPEEVKKIVSSEEPIFLDDWRILSTTEILNGDEILDYGFVKRNQIPLVDIYDNDFIVYDANKNKYVKLNIVDGCEFDIANDIFDFVQ